MMSSHSFTVLIFWCDHVLNIHSFLVMAQTSFLYEIPKDVQYVSLYNTCQGCARSLKDNATSNMPENIIHVYPAHMLRNPTSAPCMTNSVPQISLAESTSSTKLDRFQSAAYQNDVAATGLA